MLMKTINTSSVVPPTQADIIERERLKALNAPKPPAPVNKPPAPTAKPSALATALAEARRGRLIEYRDLLTGFTTATPTAMSRIVVLAGEIGRVDSIEQDAAVIAKAAQLAERLAGRAEVLRAKAEAEEVFKRAAAARDEAKAALREAERQAADAHGAMVTAYNNAARAEEMATVLTALKRQNPVLAD